MSGNMARYGRHVALGRLQFHEDFVCLLPRLGLSGHKASCTVWELFLLTNDVLAGMGADRIYVVQLFFELGLTQAYCLHLSGGLFPFRLELPSRH